MKIKCQICNSAIDINVLVVPDDGKIKGQCPKCDASYIVKPANKPQAAPLIRFTASDRAERNCIRCGKTFMERPEVTIPVCKDCSDEQSEKVETAEPSITGWRVEKSDGNIYGPYQAQELKQMIKDRLFGPSEMGITPAGSRVILGDSDEFRSFFEKFHSAQRKSVLQKSEKSTSFKSGKKRSVFSLFYIFPLVLILFLAYHFYPLLKAKNPLPNQEKIKELLEQQSAQPLSKKAENRLGYYLASANSSDNSRAAEILFKKYLQQKDEKKQFIYLSQFLEALVSSYTSQNDIANLQTTLAVLNDLIQQQNNSPYLLRAIGLIKQNLNSVSEAEQYFLQAWQQNKKDLRSNYFLALNQSLIARRKENYNLDQDPLLKLFSAKKVYPAAFFQAALLLEKNFEPGKSFALLNRYLKLYPKDDSALLLKAKIEEKRGRAQEALKILKYSLIFNPAHRPTRWLYLKISLDQQKYGKQLLSSLDILSSGLETYQQDRLASYRLQYLLFSWQTDKALQLIKGEEAKRINRYLKAKTYFQAKKYSQALKQLGDTEISGLIEERLLKAQILFKTGSTKNAFKLLKKITSSHPYLLPPALDLFFAYWRNNKKITAIKSFANSFGRLGGDQRTQITAAERKGLLRQQRLLKNMSSKKHHRILLLSRALNNYLLALDNPSAAMIEEAHKLNNKIIAEDEKYLLAAYLYRLRLYRLSGDLKRAKKLLTKLKPDLDSSSRSIFNYNAALTYADLNSSQAVAYASELDLEQTPQYLIDYAQGRALIGSGELKKGKEKLRDSLKIFPDFRDAYQALFEVEANK